jgi:hypothetical protein
MIPAVEGHLVIFIIFPISFVVVTALRRFIKNRQTRPDLPPGLVPIPLLGNILSINTKEPWLTYTQWHAVYGTWKDDYCVLWGRSFSQGT